MLNELHDLCKMQDNNNLGLISMCDSYVDYI